MAFTDTPRPQTEAQRRPLEDDSPPQPAAARTAGLAKTYPNGTEALRGVDLEIRRGEVFCLLGPNGAGKTTLARILATQLVATSGSAEILGYDLLRETAAIRRRIAMVPQQSWPDYQLKVWEHVFYYLVARGMTWRQGKDATRQIIDDLGLSEKTDEIIQNLSGGMQRRVLLAMAMASPVDLLLLDEPTSGVDVLLRRQIWKMLVATKQQRTILLTTHSMEEAEALADRLGIIADGELIAVGSVAEIRALAPGDKKILVQEEALPRAELAGFGHLQEYANRWAIFPHDDEALRALLNRCVDAEVETSVMNTTLEDVFVYLVGDRRTLTLGELE